MEHPIQDLNTLSRDRGAIISDLWGQPKSIPYSFPSASERRLESVMDKLTQTVSWFAFLQTVVLQKIEEFCRVFVRVIGNSSIQYSFQVIAHCLLLLLEINSLMNIHYLTNTVDSVIEKLWKRVCATKITSDHHRML
jgi:hypothetical protein